MKKLVAILLCFSPSLTLAADSPDWFTKTIKKADPNSLAYFADSNADCPVSTDELGSIVRGVFIRSRIKPTKIWATAELYLSLSLNCMKLKSGSNPVWVIDIHFGRWSPNPPILYDRAFGAFGIGPKDIMVSQTKDSLEKAVTHT